MDLATLMLPGRVTNEINAINSLVSETPLESAPPFEAALREIRSNPRQPLPHYFGFFIAHTGLDDKDKPLWDRYMNNIGDGMVVRWALEPDQKKTDLLRPYLYELKFPPQYASVDRMRRAFVRARFFNDGGERVQGPRDPTMFKYLLYADDECLESFQKYEAAMAAEGEGEVPVAFVKAIKCFEDDDVNGVVINAEEMEEGEIREDKGWMTVDCKQVLMFWDRVSKGQWEKEYTRFARPKRVPWWDRPAWFH
ncbi:hypothetical protein GCG54_00005424 [Colletotrichum gloeosporioides]|uniref:Uncharacterized protein n=1 Tax=Colletotrichum gloeosporioides TaxID=474922 RepID=A0A8H4CCD6_COLGL|nr:uncharacterized protein GCG54_00005424 [Colletotrichum gloeosporioides]KAF3801269.1 hypothetical protein GCG54_00005424 [Colletotrichum gloeosporioides]